MNRYAVQLISRGAVNKIGNMLYDYGNSVWLASMGTIGQTVLECIRFLSSSHPFS